MANETDRVYGVIIENAINFIQISNYNASGGETLWDIEGGDLAHNIRALQIIGPDNTVYRIPVIKVDSEDTIFCIKGSDGGIYTNGGSTNQEV